MAILGGGPAGLASGYYAVRAGAEPTIYEAAGEVGGNGRTLELRGHRFDTGAHRLHDRIPHVTTAIRSLLGGDLLRVEAPSRIWWEGRLIEFPLVPRDLLRNLPTRVLTRIGWGRLLAGLQRSKNPVNFRDYAVSSYGSSLAEMFLLNYSAKLWGAPAEHLSVAVAGDRLKGLDAKSLLLETLGRRLRKAEHLDGAFYYPRRGYGAIFEALAAAIGEERIHLDTRVTSMDHEGGRISAIVLNGERLIFPEWIISSLPLPLTVRLLRPAAPAEILEVARGMRFRSLRLAVFILARPRVTPNASIYFPGRDVAFTRLYEPKNRSRELSPPDETCLVAEVPCMTGNNSWNEPDHAFLASALGQLAGTGLIERDEVIQSACYRIPYAYPILEVGFEERVGRLAHYLGAFQNLRIVGRSARFEYSHVHDIFDDARAAIQRLAPLLGATKLNRSDAAPLVT